MNFLSYSDNDSDKNNDKNNDKNRNRNDHKRQKTDRYTNRNHRNKNHDRNENRIPINIIRIIPPILPILPKNEPIEEEPMEVEDFYNDDDYDEIIYRDIKGIDDLIELGQLYNPNTSKRKKYNINVKRLYYLIEPLTQLKNMIGMNKVKNHIVDMIVYYLQDFEKYNKNIMHTVLYGPPGCGKTELAHILAKIYCKMGIIRNDKVHSVKRSDLVGEYLGHTAKLTQKAIDNAKNSVLLIDEAYSLGNQELRDSFSKECIDTLNQNLTENKINFICIIAGYKEELQKCFFAYNPGLERRFPFRFNIDHYTADDLRLIYLKMVKDEDWQVMNEYIDTPLEFFQKNKAIFKYNGGDMETLFHMTKITHARRVFCLLKHEKKKIIYEDLQKALDLFMNDENIHVRNETTYNMMYI